MNAAQHPVGLATANAFRNWRADLRGELHEERARPKNWLARLLRRPR
jgi:hypothetical protein